MMCVLQLICSYIMWPLAVLMGVDVSDCRKVAELIGTKTLINEFVAYLDLSQLINNRAAFESHVANNGAWSWSGDDILLRSATKDTLLVNGIISVRSFVHVRLM